MTGPAEGGFSSEPPTVFDVPAPVVAESPNDPPGPLVELFDEHSHLLRTARLTRGGLHVGRSADNDLVLAEPTVSRHHAAIEWDGQHATVSDLDSDNGTWMAAVRLPAGVGRRWLVGESVGIGSWCLILRSGLEEGAARSVSYQHARVELACPVLWVVPGQPTTVLVTVTNSSSGADEFQVVAQGVPDGWIRAVDDRVPARAGQSVSVLLAIDVPRLPTGRSGEYLLTVRAISRADTRASGACSWRWMVQPFQAGKLRLRPASVAAHGQATYVATLQNLGNASMWYALHAEDADHALQLRVSPQHIEVLPGEIATAEVLAAAPRYLVGFQARRYRLRLRAMAQPKGDQSYTAEAEFAHVPLFRLPGDSSHG